MIPTRPFLLSIAAALMLTAGSAAAQSVGGIALPQGPIPGAAMAQAMAQVQRLPVSVDPNRRGAPPGAMVTNPTVSRSSTHQQLITRIRGDAGYLAGFSKGQPLAASRQPPVQPVDPSFTFIEAPFIVNNINSALNFAFGDGNVSEQQFGDGESAQPSNAASSAADPQSAAAAPKSAAPKSAAPAKTAATPDPVKPAQPDPLLTTAGPLPHLPFALEHGGAQFNNINTSTNLATGIGNRATQKVVTIQK